MELRFISLLLILKVDPVIEAVSSHHKQNYQMVSLWLWFYKDNFPFSFVLMVYIAINLNFVLDPNAHFKMTLTQY
jgi:hypothetical protein